MHAGALEWLLGMPGAAAPYRPNANADAPDMLDFIAKFIQLRAPPLFYPMSMIGLVRVVNFPERMMRPAFCLLATPCFKLHCRLHSV